MIDPEAGTLQSGPYGETLALQPSAGLWLRSARDFSSHISPHKQSHDGINVSGQILKGHRTEGSLPVWGRGAGGLVLLAGQLIHYLCQLTS